MFTTLESKGILRTAPEETMLASLHKASDPLAAEFIRTFRHEYFFGRMLLQRYEHLREDTGKAKVSVVLPKFAGGHNKTDFASLYGFRPPHAPRGARRGERRVRHRGGLDRDTPAPATAAAA